MGGLSNQIFGTPDMSWPHQHGRPRDIVATPQPVKRTVNGMLHQRSIGQAGWSCQEPDGEH